MTNPTLGFGEKCQTLTLTYKVKTILSQLVLRAGAAVTTCIIDSLS